MAIVLGLYLERLFFNELSLPLVGIACIFVSGFLDDIFELSAKYKLLFQILSVTLILIECGPHAGFEGWLYLSDGAVASYLFRGFILLGLLNAMNLIDGLDNLASGIALLGFATYSILGSEIAAFAIAVLVPFHVFNRSPARVYLGESGAQLLAVLLFLSSMQIIGAGAGMAGVLLGLPLCIPVLDMAFALHRRFKAGQSIFKADQGHIHHRLSSHGASNLDAVRTLHSWSLIASTVLVVIWLGLSIPNKIQSGSKERSIAMLDKNRERPQ